MAENLGKRPSKGILKTSSSFDSQDIPRATKETKWDEMNIIATLHPADKDYGHTKIEEPKTPYNYEGFTNEDLLDSSAVASKLAKNLKPKIFEESSEEEDETPEEKERRKTFEAKRKGHYREWEAVQLTRKKLVEEEDEDEEKTASDRSEDENGQKNKDSKESQGGQKEHVQKTEKCVSLRENEA